MTEKKLKKLKRFNWNFYFYFSDHNADTLNTMHKKVSVLVTVHWRSRRKKYILECRIRTQDRCANLPVRSMKRFGTKMIYKSIAWHCPLVWDFYNINPINITFYPNIPIQPILRTVYQIIRYKYLLLHVVIWFFLEDRIPWWKWLL